MLYKDSISKDMVKLASHDDTLFLGQGLTTGDRMWGTFGKVPTKKCLEMPIAENLIMGVANGLCLVGKRPVVVFHRMDFMLIAADQIINHTALMDKMSGGKVQMPVIIRACIGSRKESFDVGPQHNHDFRHIFSRYITTWDYEPGIYDTVYASNRPCIIVEDKDKYDEAIPSTR